MKYDEVVILIVDFMKNNQIKECSPMPVDDFLLKKVSNHLRFNIDKHINVSPIDTSSRLIFGNFRNFKNSVDIGFNENLNNCWKRFIIVKELSHLIMSKDNDGLTQDVEKLVDGLFKYSFGVSDDIDHEKLAVYMACEYLMPYKISQQILENSQKTDLDIAQKFSVPEVMVKVYRDSEFLSRRRDSYTTALEEHPVIP